MTIDNEGDTVNESQQTQADQRTKIVAVISALAEEVDLIARSLEDVRRFHQSGLDVVDGLIPLPTAGQGEEQGRIRLVATVAGMGLVNAAATTQFLIDYGRPEAIIFSGIAGNLTPDLHINDVVLGKTVRYLDSDMKLISESYPALEEFHSDPRLLDLASQVLDRRGIRYIQGVIASGNRFIEGDQKVEDVKSQTGANAAEMEGAAVLHIAAKNDIPALIIRALSDNADTEYETFKEFDISAYADTAAQIVVELVRKL